MQTMSPLTDEMLARLAGCPDARFRRIMESLVRHLHAFVREVELTPDEWLAGIRFLTATGHKSDDLRQEFILLSDTLGVSSLVDALANPAPTGATESSVLGPFFTEDAPDIGADESIASDGKGEPLLVSGTVRDTRGAPVAGAVLDVWENDGAGLYDTQYADRTRPDCRGRVRTGADGRFAFRAVLPTSYSIPTDGPVGSMMRRLNRHSFRPAHLHFKIAAPGMAPLTTAIYVKGDPYLESDAVFGVKPSLVEEFVRRDGAFVLERDFVLAPAA